VDTASRRVPEGTTAFVVVVVGGVDVVVVGGFETVVVEVEVDAEDVVVPVEGLDVVIEAVVTVVACVVVIEDEEDVEVGAVLVQLDNIITRVSTIAARIVIFPDSFMFPSDVRFARLIPLRSTAAY
jgi:hypothetical protein